jgi:meckelin
MDLLVFAAMDLVWSQHLLSAFITYLWDKLMLYIRDWLGAKNLSRKTLVDQRFLI